MRKAQSGFTLIELVVVIVILGILAATAIPRFVDMASDARRAALQGMLGAVQGASALAHAEALIKGQTGATGTIAMEGTNVTLAYGYPDGTAAGIEKALNFDATAFGFAAGSPATFTLTSGTNCIVSYTAVAVATGVPPTITSTGTGCS